MWSRALRTNLALRVAALTVCGALRAVRPYYKQLRSVHGQPNRNTSYISTYAIPNDNYGNSVAVHELGHFIVASHSTNSPAVMNQDRDRNGIIWAYADDECAINDKYPTPTWPRTTPCGY